LDLRTRFRKDFESFITSVNVLKCPLINRELLLSCNRGYDGILWDGAFTFSVKSTHPDRLVGEGLSGVIMCEAARQKERIWLEMMSHALTSRMGAIQHYTTG
jgi:hypothetical protein